jgi:hypothetical protein
MTLRFTDGIEFDTRGSYHIESKSDGLYVVGKGLLCPVDSLDEARALLAKLEPPKPRPQVWRWAEALARATYCLLPLESLDDMERGTITSYRRDAADLQAQGYSTERIVEMLHDQACCPICCMAADRIQAELEAP